MDNYKKIEIETLMGNDILPKYLEVLLPIRYIEIRRAIDKLILEKHYCKIEYDLLTNGEKKDDSCEYTSGKVLIMPKIGSGFKIDQESRVFYIPFEKPKCLGNKSSNKSSNNETMKSISREKPILTIDSGWRTSRSISENNKTRKILDMLKEKSDMKIKRRLDKKK